VAKLWHLVRHYVAALALLLTLYFSRISNMEKISKYEMTEQEQQEYDEYQKDMQGQLLEDVAESQS
tara:strand:+ start:409 stop:606 length:198 start_codon:yes stop_codon:yes gene_type:complete